MERIKLEREDRGPLIFRGSLLSSVTTYKPGKTRWTDISIYEVSSRLSAITWVVYVTGQTTADTESKRITATLCETPLQVFNALSKNGKLTKPGREAIEAAADVDEDLDDFYDELINEEEEIL